MPIESSNVTPARSTTTVLACSSATAAARPSSSSCALARSTTPRAASVTSSPSRRVDSRNATGPPPYRLRPTLAISAPAGGRGAQGGPDPEPSVERGQPQHLEHALPGADYRQRMGHPVQSLLCTDQHTEDRRIDERRIGEIDDPLSDPAVEHLLQPSPQL